MSKTETEENYVTIKIREDTSSQDARWGTDKKGGFLYGKAGNLNFISYETLIGGEDNQIP